MGPMAPRFSFPSLALYLCRKRLFTRHHSSRLDLLCGADRGNIAEFPSRCFSDSPPFVGAIRQIPISLLLRDDTGARTPDAVGLRQ
jgi:hypothetical protein